MDGSNLVDEMFLQQWVVELSTSKTDVFFSWRQAFIGEKLYMESGIPMYVPARDVPHGFLLRRDGGRRVGLYDVSRISGFERGFLCRIGRGYCTLVSKEDVTFERARAYRLHLLKPSR